MSKTVYIAGHGNFMDEYGTFAVPVNTTLKFYVDHGVGFDDSFEFAVLGKYKLDDLHLSAQTRSEYKEHTLKSGDACNDYHVHHPAGLKLSVARASAVQMPANVLLPAVKDNEYIYLPKGAELALSKLLEGLPKGEELIVHCLFCRSIGEPDDDWKGMMGGWEKQAKLNVNKLPIQQVLSQVQ